MSCCICVNFNILPFLLMLAAHKDTGASVDLWEWLFKRFNAPDTNAYSLMNLALYTACPELTLTK